MVYVHPSKNKSKEGQKNPKLLMPPLTRLQVTSNISWFSKATFLIFLTLAKQGY